MGALGLITGTLVFLAEALAFHLAYGASILMILQFDFSFAAGIRPGWYVWAAGLVLTLIAFWRYPRDNASARSDGAAPS